MSLHSSAGKGGSGSHTKIYKPPRRRGRGRPAGRKWSQEEIAAFARQLAELQAELGLSDEEMEAHLGYRSRGAYVRMLKGEYGQLRQPSEEVLRRLEPIRFRLFILREVVPFLAQREFKMKKKRERARKRMG